jgi:hypothetical protein
VFDFLKSPSDKVQAEIAAEEKRAALATAEEAKLKTARTDALLADDQKEVDRIDAQLATIGRDAERRRERVALLTSQLEKAQERERNEDLDKVAARTDRARELGESLIRKEYAKAAAALADVLHKIHAIDVFISGQNRILEKGDREQINSPNAIRTKPAWTEKRMLRQRLGIDNPRHPLHDRWNAKAGFYTRDHSGTGPTYTKLLDHTEVEAYAEVEYEVEESHTPDWKYPLYEEVKFIANAGTDRTPLFNSESSDHHERLAKFITELGL